MKQLLLFVTLPIFTTIGYSMQPLEDQPLIILSIDNQTNSNYEFITDSKPTAIGKRIITQQIVLKGNRASIFIKDPLKANTAFLLLDITHSKKNNFSNFQLSHIADANHVLLGKKHFQIDPTKGKDEYIIYLYLKGKGLSESKFEIDMSQKTIDQQLLDSIASKNFAKAIQLLNAGANPNTKIESQNAFLNALKATSSDQSQHTHLNDLIRTFINKGADIAQQDFHGETPIFNVFSVDAARALVDAGANPHHKSKNGLTAADALSNQFEDNPHDSVRTKAKEVIDYLRSIKPQKLP